MCENGGTSQKLCQSNDCKFCFNLSFASHPKSPFWSKKNELKPRQAFKASHKKYIFDCDKCKHEFTPILANITFGNWCSYCAIPAKQLCNDEKCVKCFEKSFASSPKSSLWSKKNELKPRQAFKASHKKYIFDCDKCKHEFTITPAHIKEGKWCPYCCHSPILCIDFNCKMCYEKSFASSARAVCWSKNNKLMPRQMSLHSDKKVEFICGICKHIFTSILADITNGSWCPYCINKTEAKLLSWLKSKFDTVQTQATFDWGKNIKTNRKYKYDFVINSNIIIELDGEQHFSQVSNWQSAEKTQETDTIKMKLALANGFRIIRLLQEDVLFDENDWEVNLLQAISSTKSLSSTEKILFISNNDKYKNHVESLIVLK